MATPRTNADLVKGLLLRDYNVVRQPSLDPFIASATSILNRAVVLATAAGVTCLDEDLELTERWLAAHLYTKNDPTYSSKSTSGASGSFIRDPKTPEPYKDGALMVDPTGYLGTILANQVADAEWIGRSPSERRTPDQR